MFDGAKKIEIYGFKVRLSSLSSIVISNRLSCSGIHSYFRAPSFNNIIPTIRCFIYSVQGFIK